MPCSQSLRTAWIKTPWEAQRESRLDYRSINHFFSKELLVVQSDSIALRWPPLHEEKLDGIRLAYDG